MNEQNLSQIYENRFYGIENYRNNVWKILVSNFFSKWIDSQDHILDLGCGYGEFINNVNCKARYAMDLNPKVKKLPTGRHLFYQTGLLKFLGY